MLFNSLILLLLSNSITSRRDKSILYTRNTITILMVSTCIAYYNFSILFLANGIGIIWGLFHTTANTNTFHIFILIITSVILLLISFYPRKIWIKEYSSPLGILFTKFIYYESLLLNKMGEQFKIIEYSLIILFIVTGSVFLISTNNFVSIFLSIELQSYGLYLLYTIYRDSEPATSGGLIYFLLGGLCSFFILLAIALLYVNFGSCSFFILLAIILLSTNLDSFYTISIIYIVPLNQSFRPSPHSFYSPLCLSGVSGDKGKGKAKAEFKEDTDEQITDKDKTDKDYQDEQDLDFMRDIERAKLNSLGLKSELSKRGESSAMGANSYGYDISSDLNHLKLLKDEALEKAIQYNKLKQEFMEEGAVESFTDETLNPFKEKYLNIKKEIEIIKERLLNKGIDVVSETEQDEYYSEEENYSEEEDYSNDERYSSSSEENKRVKRMKFSDDKENSSEDKKNSSEDKENSSEEENYSNDNKYYSSSSEENKPVKRMKFSDDNKPFFILPITFDFLYLLSPILNIIFLMISGLILYLIELDIIPNLSVPFINLTQLITLHIYINILMLIHKNYHTTVKLYKAYLKKDYFLIYSNFYFTIILVMFYFSNIFDTGIFYC